MVENSEMRHDPVEAIEPGRYVSAAPMVRRPSRGVGVAQPAGIVSPPGVSRIARFLELAFLLSVIMPISSKLVGLKLVWGIFGLWAMVVFLGGRFLRGTATKGVGLTGLVLMIAWTAVVVTNAVIGRGGSGRIHSIIAITMLMGSMMGTYSAWFDRGGVARIITALALVLGLQALVSIPTLFSEGGIARDLMEVNTDNVIGGGLGMTMVDLGGYALRGVGDFNLYSSLGVLFPLMLGQVWGRSSGARWLILGALVCILVSVALSTFTASVGVLILGVIALLLLMQVDGKVSGVITAGGGMLVFLVVWIAVADSLHDIAQLQFVTDKIFRLLEGVSQAGLVEGDETMRGYLATLSLDTFAQFPLFGVGPVTMALTGGLYRDVGGHCSWLDQLAEYGVVGFGPLVLFFFISSVGMLKRYLRTRKPEDAASVCMMFSAIIFGFGNPFVFIESASVPVVFVASALWGRAASRTSAARTEPAQRPHAGKADLLD